MQEESPEGGRFKKEIQIENQSYLLLIRDEGGAPEMQVSVLAPNSCLTIIVDCSFLLLSAATKQLIIAIDKSCLVSFQVLRLG